MLTAKGYAVSFVLESGRKVSAPASYAILHDPSGRSWPACSGLVASFAKGGGEIDDRLARSYFGHTPREGSLVLPPRNLSSWVRVGLANQILYTRRRPGRLPASHEADFFHDFSKPVPVYRRGKLLRVELGSGCTWNERGIVRP